MTDSDGFVTCWGPHRGFYALDCHSLGYFVSPLCFLLNSIVIIPAISSLLIPPDPLQDIFLFPLPPAPFSLPF